MPPTPAPACRPRTSLEIITPPHGGVPSLIGGGRHTDAPSPKVGFETKITTIMGYMEEVDQWLVEVLKHLPIGHLDEAKRQIKEIILQSYRNGLKATPRKTAKNTTA